MPTVQVIEHEKLDIVDKDVGEQKALPTKYVNLLQKQEKLLPKGAVTWGYNCVKFTQFCGVISLGNLTLEILPKIYGKEQDPGSCREILVKMLRVTRRLRISSLGGASINLQKYHILDIFIFHFCEELARQIRQGMIRTYVRQQENLPVVKGKLLLDTHLKLNVANQERVYCEYDELIEDNAYNQIIKYVLRVLLRVTFSGDIKRKVTELLHCFDEITDRIVTRKDIDKLYFDRSNRRYELIFEQCKWVLSSYSPDVVSGEHQAFSLLFDMNKLFEEFVAVHVKKELWKEGYFVRTQAPRKYLVNDATANLSRFMLMPDIAIFDKNRNIVAIMDTKWKVLDESTKNYGISQGDLYQMVSYASSYKINKLYLIYPLHNQVGINGEISLMVNGSDIEVKAIFVDLVSKTIKGAKLVEIGFNSYTNSWL